jgi:hypothetical protein
MTPVSGINLAINLTKLATRAMIDGTDRTVMSENPITKCWYSQQSIVGSIFVILDITLVLETYW